MRAGGSEAWGAREHVYRGRRARIRKPLENRSREKFECAVDLCIAPASPDGRAGDTHPARTTVASHRLAHRLFVLVLTDHDGRGSARRTNSTALRLFFFSGKTEPEPS